MTLTDSTPATLLYDDDCGLCVTTAAWLARGVSPRRLRVLALTRADTDPAVGPNVVGLDLLAALHFVTPDGRVLTGARAALASGRLMPRWRVLATLFDHPIGRMLLEPLYRLVATNRRVIGRRLGLSISCPIPTSDERPR